MQKSIWLMLLIVMFPICALSSEIRDQKQSYIINPQEFIGFEKCKVGKLLYTTLEKMHKDCIPIKKEEGMLIFKVKSEFLDLPIIKIIIGVCEDSSRDCGWGGYLGVVIPKSIMETDLLLKNKTGIDFKNESRGHEAGETLRPILMQSVEDKNESILFCDPGAL